MSAQILSLKVRSLTRGPLYQMLCEVAYSLVQPPPSSAAASDTVEQWLKARLHDRPIAELQAVYCPSLDALVVDIKDPAIRELVNDVATSAVRPGNLREMRVFEVLNRFHRQKSQKWIHGSSPSRSPNLGNEKGRAL
jgi:hypothetical protein